MNTDELKTSPESIGDGEDHVEVVVDDLFIEEYDVPLTLPTEPAMKADAKHALGHLRAHSKAWIGGLAALSGLVLAALFGLKRRRESTLSRVLHRVGFAR